MIKRLALFIFLAGFAFCASAQIAVPSLDTNYPSQTAAATGWRYFTTASIIYGTGEGDIEVEAGGTTTKIGEIKVAANASGYDDSGSIIPDFFGAYRGESIAAELYYQTSLKTDIDILNSDRFNDQNKSHIFLTYIFDDYLSVGLGYYQKNSKTKVYDFFSDLTADIETSQTGLGISASWRISEMFYLAAGLTSVSQTGKNKLYGVDMVDNSWTNIMYGFGIRTGEPDSFQLRAELSVLSSPESVKDAESGKMGSSHNKSTVTYASLEAIVFRNILLAYHNETGKSEGVDSSDSDTESSDIRFGIGWMNSEGLNITAYSFSMETIDDEGSQKIKSAPSGYEITVGWNF